MMVDRLGMRGDAGEEGEGLREIGKAKRPRQRVAVAGPARGWLKVHRLPLSPPGHPCKARGGGAVERTKEIAKMASATLDVGPLGLENPMGTDGFEFVEYAAPDPELLRRQIGRAHV